MIRFSMMVLCLCLATGIKAWQISFAEANLQEVVKQSDYIALLQKTPTQKFKVKAIYYASGTAIKVGSEVTVASPGKMAAQKSAEQMKTGLSVSRIVKKYTPDYLKTFQEQFKKHRVVVNELEQKAMDLEMSFVKSYHVIDPRVEKTAPSYQAIAR